VKVSLSLTDDDVRFLDERSRGGGYASRSAVVADAIRAMRMADVVDMYVEDFKAWEESGEARLWDLAASDGLDGSDWSEE